jgi:hypothetical protein
MAITVAASPLISAARREELSHATAPSRVVASATAAAVVAEAAAAVSTAAAASPAASDIRPFRRQARSLDPAGPWHLRPRPLLSKFRVFRYWQKLRGVMGVQIKESRAFSAFRRHRTEVTLYLICI